MSYDRWSQRLPALAADLCRIAETGTRPPPGAVIGVAVGDRQQIVASGDAVRTPERVQPFTEQTRTDAGSVTKIIATTAAIMTLVDSRRLALDDLVEPILGRTLPAPITVGDLLEHQGGLWEWWPLYLRAHDHDQALDLISTLPARYPRRNGRHYSDLGFMLLGAVVEKVTDLPLDKAAQELVFGPYDLTGTSFGTPLPGAGVAASSTGDRIERTMINTGVPYPVDGSVADFGGWRQHVLIGEVNDGNSFHAFGSVAGHAGVFTTAGDLLRLGRLLLDSLAGSGPLTAATVSRFVTAGPDPGQALGLRLWSTPVGPAIGHTGFPGVGFAVLPAQDAVVAMITNRLHADGPARNLETLWLSALDGLTGQEPARPEPGTSGSEPAVSSSG